MSVGLSNWFLDLQSTKFDSKLGSWTECVNLIKMFEPEKNTGTEPRLAVYKMQPVLDG